MNDVIMYVTKECYDKLHNDLTVLTTIRRKDITRQIAEARAHGDLGENAEYDAAKEAQAFNEMKIAELQQRIASARIMDESAIPLDKAVLGTTVWLKDLGDGEEIVYSLVSEPEADINNDKISISSPVGKGLLGHKEKDIVEIKVPAGICKYEITKIGRTGKNN
ncbi:MAG TPA: transcription elongation factor GreA [Chitinivibrionales bacterium]